METPDNDKAPFFKSWNYWYALVIVFLVVLIILFTFFTKRFS
jgi:Mg2+ and Co2+ transporter CorA